jgi:hypothetical protein
MNYESILAILYTVDTSPQEIVRAPDRHLVRGSKQMIVLGEVATTLYFKKDHSSDSNV